MLNFIQTNSFENNKQNVLYIEFRKKYYQIWEQWIEEFFISVGFIAVYEFMISIIAKYNVMENFKNDGNVILTFLEVISDFETREQGLQNFIDYFKNYDKNKANDKFFIKVPSNNAVKIMTIHKAKGLQFNVVIMPYFYIDDCSPKNPFCVEEDKNFSFKYIKKDATYFSKKLKDIYYKAYFKNLSDELNILYVATTRAVYEFHALIKQPKNDKNNKEYINTFISEDVRVKGKKEKKDILKEKENTVKTIDLNPNQIENIVDVISDSANEIYGRKNKDMLLKGQILHYALSLIDTFDILYLENIVEDCMIKVSFVYPNEDISWLKKTMTDLLSNKEIASLFDNGNTVFNEKEFVDEFGNTIRIDKLVIKKDSVDIIDFKSSIYDKEYIQKQLENYSRIIKTFYCDLEINKFVIDIEKREIVKF
jgi:ATP-dependent exoDNAse (exonuclease V) beta subunit